MPQNKWLKNLAEKLGPIFQDTGYPTPEIKVRPNNIAPGPAPSGLTGRYLVYISPSVSTASEIIEQVLGELIRSAGGVVPEGADQATLFTGVFSLVPDTQFTDELNTILADLGPYPEK